MLRRDFETFFLGTAITISTTGAAFQDDCACPKSCGRALQARRAAFSSQIVLPLQQFSGRDARLSLRAASPAKGVAALLRWASAARRTQHGEHVFKLDSGPSGIRIGGRRELFGGDFADIEHIPGERLRRIGLGTEDCLAALRIAFVGSALGEETSRKASSSSWVTGSRLSTQAWTILPRSRPSTITWPPGRRSTVTRAEKAGRPTRKPNRLARRRPFGVGGDDFDGGVIRAHPFEINEAFYFRF